MGHSKPEGQTLRVHMVYGRDEWVSEVDRVWCLYVLWGYWGVNGERVMIWCYITRVVGWCGVCMGILICERGLSNGALHRE